MRKFDLYENGALLGSFTVGEASGGAVAPAAGAALANGKTGFDLGTSNGNWLQNDLVAGPNQPFTFEVRPGQKRVEVTLANIHDVGNTYTAAIIGPDGIGVESKTGPVGNGVIKLLDFIGATEQRGGAASVGRDWPYGAGVFQIHLGLANPASMVIAYNHD